MILVKGYVHGDANTRLSSLKQWLPMNHRELPELLEIEFEVILQRKKQHDQRYTQQISRGNSERTVGKQIQVDELKSEWITWKQRRAST